MIKKVGLLKKIFILSTILFLILVCSTKNGFTKENSNYQVRTKKINQSSKDYKIEVKYPKIYNYQNQEIQEKFNSHIKKYIKNRISEFKKDLKKSSPVRIPWSLYYSFNIESKKKNFISLILSGSNFSGGAHPTPEFETVTFDFIKGKIIKLDDIFKPGSLYLQRLSKYCINDLKKRKISDDSFILSGAAPKKVNYQWYYISNKNLVILFPPYQVAPYAAGPQKVTIPYSEIKDIICTKEFFK